MLKKIMGTVLALSLTASSAFASVSVESEDVANDLMKVSSQGFKGESLSIIITNPGFTLEQALAGENGAIQYFGSYVPDEENFSFPVQITGSAGGEFNIYILSQDGEQKGSFVFYNSVFKKDCINKINIADENADITEDFENLVMSYGMESDEMYVKLGSEKCASAFLSLKNSLPGKKLPEDIAGVLKLINDAFVIAAFNDSDKELCFEDSKLLHTDVLGIADSDELKDYYESIDSDAIADFDKELFRGGYKTIEDIALRFKELVYINVLVNFNQRGYGHVHGYFEKYKKAYEDAGFDIPKKENESIYRQLLGLEADTLEELAEKFNGLEDNSKKGSSGSKGSGGGGGGNFSVGAGTSYVTPEPEKTPEDTPDENTVSIIFTDVKKDFWAYEPIEALSKKGWINGYEDGSFRPDARITRAEYTKLLLTVFAIAPGGEVRFDDVSPDAWYAPYVAAANEKGIVNGDGEKFRPDDSLNRQDAAVILCRILNKKSDTELTFDDVNLVADYAYSSVAYLTQIGVINGYEDNTFRPVNTISRAEVAKIIHSLILKGEING